MTLLLEPILIRTAKMAGSPEGSVRIVWVTSLLHAGSPYMKFEDDGTPVVLAKLMDNYMQSKVGAAWLGDKFAKRLGDQGILSVVSIPWVGWR
jgi:retinol dehydrogenase 12